MISTHCCLLYLMDSICCRFTCVEESFRKQGLLQVTLTSSSSPSPCFLFLTQMFCIFSHLLTSPFQLCCNKTYSKQKLHPGLGKESVDKCLSNKYEDLRSDRQNLHECRGTPVNGACVLPQTSATSAQTPEPA